MDFKADNGREAGLARPPIAGDSATAMAGHAPLTATIPAPIHFAICFAAGAGLQHLLALPLPPERWLGAIRIAGTVLANAGLLLALASMGLFARARTTILPSGTASRLVTGGPYRISRNPMYLSLILAHAGIAAMLGVPWALALLPVPVLLLQRVQIPFEEARMRTRFGDAYLRYCEQVRRWL